MRHVSVILFVLASTTSCNRGATASRDAAFWAWFASHQTDLAKVERADEPIANDLGRELHKVDARLAFELGVKVSPHELIISADGAVSAFPAVKRLVAAAPAVPGWKVIAFRPRLGTSYAIELGDGSKLSGDDISFRVIGAKDGKLDVALYVKAMATVSNATKQAVFLQLDSALGEYDVETRLGTIDIEPGMSMPNDARPFRDLPGAVDAVK